MTGATTKAAGFAGVAETAGFTDGTGVAGFAGAGITVGLGAAIAGFFADTLFFATGTLFLIDFFFFKFSPRKNFRQIHGC